MMHFITFCQIFYICCKFWYLCVVTIKTLFSPNFLRPMHLSHWRPLCRRYMKYLYPYECEKMKLSNPAELQCAIDGNRREGRRSSYGTYGDTVQPPLLPLQNLQSLQNLQNLQNPLSLVPRPQLNGNGNGGSHPLAPQDYLLGELALRGTLGAVGRPQGYAAASVCLFILFCLTFFYHVLVYR